MITERNCSHSQSSYPILSVNTLYEKVHMDGKIVSMVELVVCGVDEHGQRNILAHVPHEDKDALSQNLKTI